MKKNPKRTGDRKLRLFSKAQAKLPFYEGSSLSLPKLRDFLGASDDEIAQMVGKSARTIQRHEYATRDIRDRLQPVLYGINLLVEIAELKEIQRWIREPLKEWKGRTPLQELIRGNSQGVLNLIEGIYAGEGGY